jgi:precorrin-2 dehydrogenase
VPEKHYYVACLDLEGRSTLVVGGGRVALEKTHGLLDAGARVTVIAPEIDPAFGTLSAELVVRGYRRDDLDGRFLVVSATGVADVDGAVYDDAEARQLLCNVADGPDHCNFILPAVHRVGPIAVAVSTGGASPALAQRIRDDIAAIVGPRHARLARELQALRPWAKSHLPSYEARKAYFAERVEEALR